MRWEGVWGLQDGARGEGWGLGELPYRSVRGVAASPLGLRSVAVNPPAIRCGRQGSAPHPVHSARPRSTSSRVPAELSLTFFEPWAPTGQS